MPIDASEVLLALQNIPEKLEVGMLKAMTDACISVEGEARRECPSDDGTLKRSITHEITKEDGKIIGYVGTNIFYAPFIHQGTGIFSPLGRKQVPWRYKDLEGNWHTTKGIKPNPFMQRAVDKQRNDILTHFKGVLGDGDN